MNMENNLRPEPSIYVGTYKKYNNGSIKGAWLKPNDYNDKDSFLVACSKLHSDEVDPELMFQDYENIPDGMISESSIEAELWEWLAMNDEDKELLAVYRKHVDQSGTLEQARDTFMGTFDSEEDWAEDYLSEGGLLNEVPESLRGYIDYEKYARDASYNGMSFVRHNGDVWVFSPA
jgi:antirestriction protein